MTMSMSSLSRTVAFLMTENAIENQKASDLIAETAHQISQADLAFRNAEKDHANQMQAVMSNIQTVESAVSVAQAGAKVGQAAKDLSQRFETQPKLSTEVD